MLTHRRGRVWALSEWPNWKRRRYERPEVAGSNPALGTVSCDAAAANAHPLEVIRLDEEPDSKSGGTVKRVGGSSPSTSACSCRATHQTTNGCVDLAIPCASNGFMPRRKPTRLSSTTGRCTGLKTRTVRVRIPPQALGLGLKRPGTHAQVAQLEDALVSDARGCGFESHSGHFLSSMPVKTASMRGKVRMCRP